MFARARKRSNQKCTQLGRHSRMFKMLSSLLSTCHRKIIYTDFKLLKPIIRYFCLSKNAFFTSQSYYTKLYIYFITYLVKNSKLSVQSSLRKRLNLTSMLSIIPYNHNQSAITLLFEKSTTIFTEYNQCLRHIFTALTYFNYVFRIN